MLIIAAKYPSCSSGFIALAGSGLHNLSSKKEKQNMPLVNAKCTNCGASLEVDHAKDAAICPYCGSAFVVEKAVNSYNISNNITGSVVNIYGGVKNDFDIQGGVLVKYTGTSMDVVLPDTVRKIGERCFACSMLTSVVIPASVTAIGEFAFAQCTELTSITIPNGVKKIDNFAFSECTGLKNVSWPASVPIIRMAVFVGCTGLAGVTIPNGVTTIENQAFSGCTSLTSIILPDSLAEIEFLAFRDCINLSDVTLPYGSKRIAPDAFRNTPYEKHILEVRLAREKELQQEAWRTQGRCPKCGGERSVFGKCKSCGYKG